MPSDLGARSWEAGRRGTLGDECNCGEAPDHKRGAKVTRREELFKGIKALFNCSAYYLEVKKKNLSQGEDVELEGQHRRGVFRFFLVVAKARPHRLLPTRPAGVFRPALSGSVRFVTIPSETRGPRPTHVTSNQCSSQNYHVPFKVILRHSVA